MNAPQANSIITKLIVCPVVALAAFVTFASFLWSATAQADTAQLIEQIAQQTYARVRASGEIYAWEVAGPRDRIPHPCADECACLAKKFSADFVKQRVPTTTFLLRPKSGAGFIEIRGVSKGIFNAPAYPFHYITAIKLNGTWMILDPVVTGNAKLEPVQIWEKRLKTPVSFTKVNP